MNRGTYLHVQLVIVLGVERVGLKLLEHLDSEVDGLFGAVGVQRALHVEGLLLHRLHGILQVPAPAISMY